MLLEVWGKPHCLILVLVFYSTQHERSGTCFVLLTWCIFSVFSGLSKTKILVNSSVFHHDSKSLTYVTKSRCHKVTPHLAVAHSARAGSF